MKVLVIGGTGFTGERLVRRLQADGDIDLLRCLYRSSSGEVESLSGVEWVEGDLDRHDTLDAALNEVSLVYYVASLGFGHAPNIIQAMHAAGVRRGVFTSTTGIFTSLSPPSKAVRLEAEDQLRASGLDVSILRPTMIYGSEGDRNMYRLLRFIRKSPVIPVFGPGECLQQPVFVEDLVSALVAASKTDCTIGKSYNISGKEPLTFNQVVETAAHLMGRRVRRIHLPAGLVVRTLKLAERLRIPVPLKSEQVLRLNEDKSFEHVEASSDFGYSPRTFAEGIGEEIRQLGWGKAQVGK